MTALPSSATRWIVRPAPDGAARLRLFCFPYAGAGASMYYGWKELLPRGAELCAIQLPGREDRFGEPPFEEWPVLVERLADALEPALDRPFAFFGHSLGALVAFEITRELRRRGRPQPVHLFVSGRSAAHLPMERTPIHTLPDAEFTEEVAKMNGTPEEVLRHEELMALMLPILRADFRLAETYRYREEPPLSVPLSAYGGAEDEEEYPARVEAWREHTRGAFRWEIFPGGHFFVNEHRAQVVAAVRGELQRVLG